VCGRRSGDCSRRRPELPGKDDRPRLAVDSTSICGHSASGTCAPWSLLSTSHGATTAPPSTHSPLPRVTRRRPLPAGCRRWHRTDGDDTSWWQSAGQFVAVRGQWCGPRVRRRRVLHGSVRSYTHSRRRRRFLWPGNAARAAAAAAAMSATRRPLFVSLRQWWQWEHPAPLSRHTTCRDIGCHPLPLPLPTAVGRARRRLVHGPCSPPISAG